MSACPGPCNAPHRGPRRRPAPAPTAGASIWCAPCSSLLRARLAELTDLAARVGTSLDRRATGLSERVSGTPGRPSPSPAVDDLDELLQTLLTWEDAYRELRNFAPRPRRGRYTPTLSACITWLTTHLDGLLTFDGAQDFGQEVLSLHRRLRARASLDGPPRELTNPCPSCDLLTLKHDPTADEIHCQACGWTTPAQQRHPLRSAS
ncbi:hypothetical protein [Actinomadura rayongensis]|uniref:Uncharacterized protein n=1 Tax=Actinomadura rayongensis TaxID=1429076 RepID=A0A6I4W6W3_9ACTN|nr:hypothetical protein [Actinomadura rayongensis]MXQ63956.1 hypothetical protein [Actinomadura rayongensis]